MAQSEFRFDAPGSSEPAAPRAAGAPPRGAPVVSQRHALGLPAGSIRALLTFMILGLIWALMYMQKPIPLYLQYLMFMILGHYFASRHQSAVPVDVREPSPLYMPRGFLRTLIVLGFLGLIGAMVYQHRDDLDSFLGDLRMSTDKAKERFLPLLLVIGFFLGLIAAKVGRLIGGKDGQPGWYQDIQAWLALLAVVALGAEIVIQLIINPTLDEDKQIKLPDLQNILAAIVGFYFGARS